MALFLRSGPRNPWHYGRHDDGQEWPAPGALGFNRLPDLSRARVSHRRLRLETAHDDFRKVGRDGRIELARVCRLLTQKARDKIDRSFGFMRQMACQHLVCDETKGV